MNITNALTTSFTFLFLLFYLPTASGQPVQRMNPEERVERQIEAMSQQLTLSEVQAEKLKEVLFKYNRAMQEARREAGGDRSKMRESMMGIRQERREEIKKYLTEAQFKKWEEIQAQQMQRRRMGSPNLPRDTTGNNFNP